MTKKRWVDRSRDSSLILTYHQPHRVSQDIGKKSYFKNRPKRNTGKKERKITEVKRAQKVLKRIGPQKWKS